MRCPTVSGAIRPRLWVAVLNTCRSSAVGAVVAERLLHPTAGYPLLAIEALGVDLEQHRDRVPGPLRDLDSWYVTVESRSPRPGCLPVVNPGTPQSTVALVRTRGSGEFHVISDHRVEQTAHVERAGPGTRQATLLCSAPSSAPNKASGYLSGNETEECSVSTTALSRPDESGQWNRMICSGSTEITQIRALACAEEAEDLRVLVYRHRRSGRAVQVGTGGVTVPHC